MKTSLIRKFIMGLSGLFLITFITIHLLVNSFSLGFFWDGAHLFNEGSHFMATNPLIQIMQYVLAAGFLIHIIWGILLTIQNSKARPIKYAKNNAAASSSFSSRSMIYSGALVLFFLIIHMKHFFVQIKFNDLGGFATDYDLLRDVFTYPLFVGLYLIGFIALGIHLNHGFQSAFQSMGANHSKYTPFLKKLGVVFSILIAVGFSTIALFHYIDQLN